MRQVWKYVIDEHCEIKMPAGSKILHVAAQGGHICMLAMVNPESPSVRRSFSMFATGQHIPEWINLSFLGTATIDDWRMTLHVFEVLPPTPEQQEYIA